jgi:hypothetical protein
MPLPLGTIKGLSSMSVVLGLPLVCARMLDC